MTYLYNTRENNIAMIAFWEIFLFDIQLHVPVSQRLIKYDNHCNQRDSKEKHIYANEPH